MLENSFPVDWDGLPLRIDPVTLKLHERQRREDDIRKEHQSQIDRLEATVRCLTKEVARLQSLFENNNPSLPDLKPTPTTVVSPVVGSTTSLSLSHVTAALRGDPVNEPVNPVESIVEVRMEFFLDFAPKHIKCRSGLSTRLPASYRHYFFAFIP